MILIFAIFTGHVPPHKAFEPDLQSRVKGAILASRASALKFDQNVFECIDSFSHGAKDPTIPASGL